MPLASISKVTSTCGTPRGDGGMPSRMNLPSVLLSKAISRSPCRTWISTDGWLSEAVEKTCVLLVGTVVFFSIKRVITPPSVSMPKESGVTSKSKTSFTSPCKIPPWIAAPSATTSSGLMSLCGSLPMSFLTASWIAGILVWPPTMITSSMSFIEKPASFIVLSVNSTERSMYSRTSSSSFARLSFKLRCLGPSAACVMKGMLMSVSRVLESSCFDRSAASFKRWSARTSFDKSSPWSFLNSSTSQRIIFWSKSSPPRWVSPPVALTSIVSSPISKTEMSKVPPPKS